MDAVVRLPTARPDRVAVAVIRPSGAVPQKAVGAGVSNLLLEDGSNVLLENGGVLLISD